MGKRRAARTHARTHATPRHRKIRHVSMHQAGWMRTEPRLAREKSPNRALRAAGCSQNRKHSRRVASSTSVNNKSGSKLFISLRCVFSGQIRTPPNTVNHSDLTNLVLNISFFFLHLFVTFFSSQFDSQISRVVLPIIRFY